MSYNIGQITRASYSEYEINKLDSITISNVQSPYSANTAIKDKALKYDFTEGITYHFTTTLTPHSMTGQHIVKIKLVNENTNQYQTIKVLKQSFSFSFNIDLIFKANYNFTHLVFEILRTNLTNADAYLTPSNNVNTTKLTEVKNIVKELQLNRLKKVGIQGPFGLKFAINGEEIKLGKSGIFTSEEMDIASIGFIIEEYNDYGDTLATFDNKAFFIMDYQY